jgi:hypothetical protein
MCIFGIHMARYSCLYLCVQLHLHYALQASYTSRCFIMLNEIYLIVQIY